MLHFDQMKSTTSRIVTSMLRTFGTFAAAITIVASSSMLAGCDDSSGGKSDREDEIGAEVMCEEFVKDRLKAPATAKFSEESAKSIGDQRWDVKGSVDAENGFGALLRMHFRCDIHYAGNDKWRAKTVAVH